LRASEEHVDLECTHTQIQCPATIDYTNIYAISDVVIVVNNFITIYVEPTFDCCRKEYSARAKLIQFLERRVEKAFNDAQRVQGEPSIGSIYSVARHIRLLQEEVAEEVRVIARNVELIQTHINELQKYIEMNASRENRRQGEQLKKTLLKFLALGHSMLQDRTIQEMELEEIQDRINQFKSSRGIAIE
jgi:hypothetical protein